MRKSTERADGRHPLHDEQGARIRHKHVLEHEDTHRLFLHIYNRRYHTPYRQKSVGAVDQDTGTLLKPFGFSGGGGSGTFVTIIL